MDEKEIEALAQKVGDLKLETAPESEGFPVLQGPILHEAFGQKIDD